MLALEQDCFRLNQIASKATSRLKRESCSTSLVWSEIHAPGWKPQCFHLERFRSSCCFAVSLVQMPRQSADAQRALPVEVIGRACSCPQSSDRVILEVACALALIAAPTCSRTRNRVRQKVRRDGLPLTCWLTLEGKVIGVTCE